MAAKAKKTKSSKAPAKSRGMSKAAMKKAKGGFLIFTFKQVAVKTAG